MIERKIFVEAEQEGRYHYPINISQVENLLGQMLTQIEVMNLKNEKSTKDVFRQLVWRWYDGVQENSVTSYQNCIAPIYSYTSDGRVRDDGPQTNRWGYMCPNGCDESSHCKMCPPSPEENKNK